MFFVAMRATLPFVAGSLIAASQSFQANRSVEPAWAVSTKIYSEYTSCKSDVTCDDHPLYPFIMRRAKLIRLNPILDPPRNLPYEEMGISLIQLTPSGYRYFYRANFPKKLSQARTGLLDANLHPADNREPQLVPGIPPDPADFNVEFAGPEDPRAFRNPAQQIMLIYCRVAADGKRAMYLFNTVTKTQVKLSDFGEQVHKNWTPLTYKSSTELILFYKMDPVELVSCKVDSGVCEFIKQTTLRFFQKGVTLRGGSPFNHLRDNYYYSFARTADRFVNGFLQYYRPVFMIVKYDKMTNELDPVFVSSPFDFYGAPQRLVNNKLPPNDRYFDYMLPYTAILISNGRMIVTLNVKDNYNVMVSLDDAKQRIDEIIRQYETVDCLGQVKSKGWDTLMNDRSGGLQVCQERLKYMWRVAVDSAVWENAQLCLSKGIVKASDYLQAHRDESPYILFNEATRALFATEVNRVCAEKRDYYAEWLKLSNFKKREYCQAATIRDVHFEFKCRDVKPARPWSWVKKAGAILGTAALLSHGTAAYLNRESQPAPSPLLKPQPLLKNRGVSAVSIVLIVISTLLVMLLVVLGFLTYRRRE